MNRIALFAAAFACGAPTPPPSLRSVQVHANSLNALSAVVSFDARGVDCARVSYAAPEDGSASTPCVPVNGPSQVAVVGLLPGVHYTGDLELFRGPSVVLEAPVELIAGALPDDLGAAHLAITGDPPAGYVLTGLNYGSHGYAVAFDGQGRLRWYRAVPGPVFEIKQQRNGDFTTFVQPPTTGGDGYYLEYDPSGAAQATWTSPDNPPFTDGHEFQLAGDAFDNPAGYFFTYRLTTLPDGSQVAIHSMVRKQADGAIFSIYDSAGHVTAADVIEGPGLAALPDIDHPNSLDFADDGNYVVSFRNLGEVDKIDAVSGGLIWRFGGTHNQFTVIGDPLGGFSAQHCARVLPDDHLLVYDNGWRHSPQQTRVVEYQLDETALTATMVWQYTAGFFTPYTGSVQRLVSGDTFVGWANGTAQRVDANGELIWQGLVMSAAGTRQSPYRILAVPSLYEYQDP